MAKFEKTIEKRKLKFFDNFGRFCNWSNFFSFSYSLIQVHPKIDLRHNN